MMLHIPEVLTPEQVKRCREVMEKAAWVDGNVTAGHQSRQVKYNLQLPEDSSEARDLGKRGIADHEVRPELSCFRGAGGQNIVLAQLELQMRRRHQHRRQAPQHDEQLTRDAVPASAAQQDDDDQDACDDKRDVSGAAQHQQIGIVLVGGRERHDRRGKPEQDETDAMKELHDASRPK